MKITKVCELTCGPVKNLDKLIKVLEENGYMIDNRYVYDEIIKEEK